MGSQLNQKQTAVPLLGLSAVLWLAAVPLQAQNPAVPRTRTFSGLVAPAFPYAQPEEVGLSSETLNRLGEEIVSWVANGELVGAELLVIKNGRAVFHEAYGWSDREARRPMRRNSIFTIQSMSKPFTATAVLMLVEEGKLSLDDPVSRYVPGFTHDSITIHHLLSHTSGFIHDGDWYALTSPDASLEELVEEWPHRDPEIPVGTYQYADFNFAHLAYIVAKASGTPIDVFIEERIIRPLGLEDTRIGFSSDPVWRARLNSWYRWNDRAGEYDLRWHPSTYRGWTIYPGGTGLLSTAMDYAEFLAMWLNGGEWRGVRLLSDATVEMALRPHAYQEDGSAAYGYGWFVEDVARERRPFWHGGGHGTRAMAFPADDAMVIYMTQSRWGGHSAALENRLFMSGLFAHPGIGLEFRNMVWADAADVAEVGLPPEQRARYVGTYTGESREERAEVLRVWEEEGILHIRMGRSGSEADRRYHLVPLGKDRFALGRYEDGVLRGVDPTHGVRFVVANGVASKLEVTEGDRVQFTAHREQR